MDIKNNFCSLDHICYDWSDYYIMIYFVAAVIALIAADRIETDIHSKSAMVTFTFFSTVFLGLLILIPETTAVAAALTANFLSSMTRRQPINKKVVNTVSVSLSILAAAGAYTIFGGIDQISFVEVVEVVAAGVVFSIVNFLSLAIMISLVTKQSLRKELDNYYVVVVLEMLPPIFAGLTALVYFVYPGLSLLMLLLLTVLFRPHYDVEPHKAVPKGRWNITPYKEIIRLGKRLENTGK